MVKELLNCTGKGFRARYSVGAHSVELYFGESMVHTWSVARGELEAESGDTIPQYRIDAFVAQRVGELFRRIENCECDLYAE